MTPENGGSIQRNGNSSSNFLTPSRLEVASLKCSSPFLFPIQTNPSDTSRRDGYVVSFFCFYCLDAFYLFSLFSDDETSSWVTVFGYDQAQANSVLQHFSHIGTIEKYVVSYRHNL